MNFFNNPYENFSVTIDWQGITRIVLSKYLKLGLEVKSIYFPKEVYMEASDEQKKKFNELSKIKNEVFGISKDNMFNIYVNYPTWIEELDCNGKDILPDFKWDMTVIFNHIYTDDFIREMIDKKESNVQIYAKEDLERPVWSIEDGKNRVAAQNLAILWMMYNSCNQYPHINDKEKENKDDNESTENTANTENNTK